MNIFTLFGSILIKGGDAANKQIDETDKKGSKLGTTLKNIGAGIAKAGVAIGSMAVAGATALMGLAGKASEATSRIEDLSQKIGISKTGFQEWDFILSQCGASIETLQPSMKSLSMAADEAAQGTETYTEAFDRLGVSVLDNNGKLKGQEQLFNEVFLALAKVENETERTALASRLLGRGATELSPVLNAGADSLEAMRQKAHDLGLVLSDELVAAGDDFGDTMDQMKASAQAGFIKAIGPLLPALNNLFQTIITYLPMITSALAPIFEALMPIVDEVLALLVPILVNDILPLLPTVATIIASLFQTMSPFLSVLADLAMTILPPILEAVNKIVSSGVLDAIIALIMALFEAGIMPLLDALMPLLPILTDLLVQILTPLLPPLTELVKTLLPPLVDFLTLVIDIVSEILNAAMPIIEALLPPLIDLLTFLTDLLGGAVRTAFEFFGRQFERIMEIGRNVVEFFMNVFSGNWAAAWENVKNIFNTVWEGITDFLSTAWTLGRDLILGIWDGIKNMASWIWDKISGFVKNSILGPIKKTLGISSPATTGKYFGRMEAVGIGEGAEDELPNLTKVSKKMAKALIPEAQQNSAAYTGGAAVSTAMPPIQINNPIIMRASDVDWLMDLMVRRLKQLGVVTG